MNESKKIEPTDAMVEAALFQRPLTLGMIRAILRDVLNHPDAAGLFADEDALRAAREQGWDEAAGWVWQRETWTDDELRAANPHRLLPTLPTKDGTQIIPAHGVIEAVRNGVTYTAVRATYDGLEGVWVAVWRGEDDHSTYEMHAREITPGTWKEADQ